MSTRLNDRAAGVLLGTACGDALGAGYEGGPPLPDDAPIAMIGRGFFAPGEWTDDTSMAVAVAEAGAKGLDLRTGDGLDHVADGFLRWYADGHKGIGRQTRAVLRASGAGGSAAMTAAAAEYAARLPHESAGNGALMRTAALALAYLDDPSGLVAAAKGDQRPDPRRSGQRRGVCTMESGHPPRRTLCHVRWRTGWVGLPVC